MRVTCLNCEFWSRPIGWDESWAIQSADCRRRSPILLPLPEYDAPGRTAKWPQTDPHDWCAEAQPVSHATTEERRIALEKMKNSPSWEYLQPRKTKHQQTKTNTDNHDGT